MKLIFTLTLIAFSSVAVSAPIGPSSIIPIGPSTGSGGGSGPAPPPTCSNSLDFTQACNSQYAGAIL